MPDPFDTLPLLQKDNREALDERLAKHSLLVVDTSHSQPWPEEFRVPYTYGDIVNQEIFSQDQLDMIPNEFRIALPTKEISVIWEKNK